MVLRPSTPSKLLTLAALTLITLLLLPQTATAITTNLYKGILGEEGANTIYSYPPLIIVRPAETPGFWAWRTSLNDMFNELQLEGKYVSKFDVLYEINNHPTYDPDRLKAEVINAINTTAPNSNLTMFGHMGADQYIPYRFLSGYIPGIAGIGNAIPDSWAVSGDVIVYTSDVNSVTLSKPVSELPGLIVLIGCESLPDYAVEYNFTWAHMFKLSKRFYPYTIYWYQRGILGFNDTVDYENLDVFYFVKDTIEYAQTGNMGDALKQSAEENNLNLVLQYYTGRYTYTYEYYSSSSGSNTAVYVGDYNLMIDPTFDNEVAEKVIGYIKTRYPEIYHFLSMVSDGLIELEVKDTLLQFPGFGSVTKLEMKFDKNITDVNARVVAWLKAYLWNGNIIKFSVSAHILTNNLKGAEWARSLGVQIANIINETAVQTISGGSDLTPRFVDMSKPPRETHFRVIPYVGEVPVYLGASGEAYVSSLVIDRISKNGTGYLAITFVDNTPYLLEILENAAPTNDGFKLSENDALRSVGLGDKKAQVVKAWALLPQGLVPAYIIRYSDDFGAHTRVVDASTGAVLYSSDGGLGSGYLLSFPYLSSFAWVLVGVAIAGAILVPATWLWKRRRR